MPEVAIEAHALTAELRQSIPWRGKEAIQSAAAYFNHPSNGDDGALIPNLTGSGWLILAAEGMTEDFLAQDPWFAGWSAIMANVSDITAMGGRAIAAVDVQWSCPASALEGMAAAAEAFDVPVVGGHSGEAKEAAHLAVAMLGETHMPLHGDTAQAGDDLIAVIDQRGQWRGDFPAFGMPRRRPPLIACAVTMPLFKSLPAKGFCTVAEISAWGAFFRPLPSSQNALIRHSQLTRS